MDDRRDRTDPDRTSDDPAAEKRNPSSIAPTAAPTTDPAAGPTTPRAEPAAAGGAGPTSEQLRDDIDSGRTRDKVVKSDPAAAPLGTDAEASGNTPTPGQVSTARRHETGRSVSEKPSAARTETQASGRSNKTIIWAVVAVVVIAILLALLF